MGKAQKRQTALEKKQNNARSNTRSRSRASQKPQEKKTPDDSKKDQETINKPVETAKKDEGNTGGEATSTEPAETVISKVDESIQDIGYHPFNMPVTERPYTKPNIEASELTQEIPEPVIKSMTLEELEALNAGIDPSQATFNAPDLSGMPSAKEPEQPSQFNPAFHDLSKKDKQKGAEAMADVAIDGYARLKNLMANVATISENRLDREIADGQINPNLQLPIDEYGNTATLKEFANEWNNEVKEVCETSDEFKEEVKPMIVEEFMKRGVGMTNMQKLIYTVGMDLTTTTISVIQLRRVGNGFFESWRELSVNGGYTQPVQTPTPRPQAQPTSESSAQTETSVGEKPVAVNTANESSQTPQAKQAQPMTVHNELSNAGGEDGHFAPAQTVSGVPEFGADPELMEHMQKLADREKRREQQNQNKDI